MVLGVISLILALLPLVSGWFLMISWLIYILAPLGLIFGIIAIVKKQPKAVVATIVCAVALLLPLLLDKTYEDAAMKSVDNALSFTVDAMESLESLGE